LKRGKGKVEFQRLKFEFRGPERKAEDEIGNKETRWDLERPWVRLERRGREGGLLTSFSARKGGYTGENTETEGKPCPKKYMKIVMEYLVPFARFPDSRFG
jgi:hypothetical protein